MKWTILFIAAFYLCSSVYAQDPIVTITETEPETRKDLIEVKRDQDVTMSCFVENKQESTVVRWKKVYYDSEGRLQIEKVAEDTSVEDNIKTSIEKPTTFTWRLRLKSVQLSDQGNYTCYVQTTRDNTKEANRTVIVAIEPYLDPERTSSDLTVRAGDEVDMYCTAEGKPEPTIQWTRLGGALLPIGKKVHYESKMTIGNVKPEDRGKYRCLASNIINGEPQLVKRDITLQVKFAPLVTPVYRTLSQAPGFVIELQCYIEANPFPPDETGLSWVKGSRVISSSISNYRVNKVTGAFNRLTFELIFNPVEEDDYGTYQCVIRNSEGTTTQSIELTRSNSPRPSVKLGAIVEGGATSLSVCLATIITCLFVLLLQ